MKKFSRILSIVLCDAVFVTMMKPATIAHTRLAQTKAAYLAHLGESL